MVKRVKTYISAIVISSICAVLFIGIGYLYISAGIKEVENSQSSVPYSSFSPENAGIMFNIADSKTLIFLDFDEQRVAFLNADDKKIEENTCCGYSIDYTVSADYDFLADLVDLVGGIELKGETDTLNYTGVQLIELVSSSAQREDLRRDIAAAIFERISLNSFSRSDFAFIIENTLTDLTIPDCYYWSDYIKDMCANPYFVN